MGKLFKNATFALLFYIVVSIIVSIIFNLLELVVLIYCN